MLAFEFVIAKDHSVFGGSLVKTATKSRLKAALN